MRPKSILIFERIFFVSLALGVVNSALNWNSSLQQLAADPATANFGSGFMILTLLFTWGISLLFWYFIARKASNVAKWIYTIFFAIGLLMMPFTIMQFPPLVMVLTLIITALSCYALYLLFRPDAKEWFENKGKIADLEKTFE